MMCFRAASYLKNLPDWQGSVTRDNELLVLKSKRTLPVFKNRNEFKVTLLPPAMHRHLLFGHPPPVYFTFLNFHFLWCIKYRYCTSCLHYRRKSPTGSERAHNHELTGAGPSISSTKTCWRDTYLTRLSSVSTSSGSPSRTMLLFL